MSPSASVASTVAPPEPPPPPPTLGRVALEHDELKGRVATLHTIEGAVMVAAGAKVLRLREPGDLEEAGTIPQKKSMWGDNEIRAVFGRWPELLGAEYQTTFGRAPQPTYAPLKGGGGWYGFAPGGGIGVIYGVAHHGETTTVAGYDMYEGYRIIKVRGPLVKPTFTPRGAASCPEDEQPSYIPGVKPAVKPSAYGSTRKGTIISVGVHCQGHPAAEVWREIPGKGTIVSLKNWLKEVDWSTRLMRGPGDTLYLDAATDSPILRYRDGDFAPLPVVPGGRRIAFVAPDGRLFAASAKSLFEMKDENWERRADLAFPAEHTALAAVGDRFVATQGGTLYELKPTEPSHLDPAADDVDCATPFIFLFDARPKTPKHYRFPQTAAKMASFDRLDDIDLVDFVDGRQRVGIKAKTWKTAQAAWAHVKKTMPDEHPMMLCYDPPEPRVVNVIAKDASPAATTTP